MLFWLASFIGIAINIWTDTPDDGGTPGPGPLALQQRNLSFILDRNSNNIYTRT